MKIRNKNTGKVVIADCIAIFNQQDELGTCDAIDEFYTLSELNANWEDYTPAEPLIKDEKVRKAVRAWAEVNGVDNCIYYGFWEGFYSEEVSIGFSGAYKFELEDDKNYTIAELCGEEDE